MTQNPTLHRDLTRAGYILTVTIPTSSRGNTAVLLSTFQVRNAAILQYRMFQDFWKALRLTLKTHRRPLAIHLVLQHFWVAGLEACRLPSSSGRIFIQQQRVTDNLSSLHRTVSTMSVVRNQRERARVWVKNFIIARPASSRKGPHDVLAIINVDVVANKDQSVDRVSYLIAKYNVPNLF